MATLKRINPWVTGETITAEGLNGAKTGTWILELSEEEYINMTDPSSTETFSINLIPELSWYDFENMYIKTPSLNNPVYDSYFPFHNLVQEQTYIIDNDAIIMDSYTFYNPSTGVLSIMRDDK